MNREIALLRPPHVPCALQVVSPANTSPRGSWVWVGHHTHVALSIKSLPTKGTGLSSLSGMLGRIRGSGTCIFMHQRWGVKPLSLWYASIRPSHCRIHQSTLRYWLVQHPGRLVEHSAAPRDRTGTPLALSCLRLRDTPPPLSGSTHSTLGFHFPGTTKHCIPPNARRLWRGRGFVL